MKNQEKYKILFNSIKKMINEEVERQLDNKEETYLKNKNIDNKIKKILI